MTERTVDVRVTGQVQGVSFRWYCEEQANALGVRGTVRNEPDGAVVGHFEGTAEAVGQLVAWCHTGSPSAQVERVEVTDAAATGATDFHVGF